MSFDLEYIDRLIAEEIAGTISPENKGVLERAKDADGKVRKLWEERHSLFESREIMEWLLKKRKFEPLAKKKRTYVIANNEIQLWPRGKPKPIFYVANRKSNKIKIVVISVAIVIFLSFLVYWINK